MHIQLSNYGNASATPSPVSEMMASFATDFRDGIDINLGVGYVNEDTIPTQRILEATHAIMEHPQQYRQAFNYGGPQGSQNLIDSIRTFLLHQQIGGLDEETLSRNRLIIGPSGATSILDGIAEILPKGIVITSDPMYYIYCNTLERKGLQVSTIPEGEDGVSGPALEAHLAKLGEAVQEISFFYFVTVNNPSCCMLSNARRREIVDVVARLSQRLGRRIPVFFDLAYELLLHDPDAPAFESALKYDPLGIVYEIGTLSKILAPALRVGYLLGPDGPFMRAMVQKTNDVGFSAPLFSQEIAGYLLTHCAAEQLQNVNVDYRRKALAVREAIQKHLGDSLENCCGGQAGFYYYLTLNDIETHANAPFFHFLTRTTGTPDIDGPAEQHHPRVIYIPGEYCVHPQGALVQQGRRQLRLSYGFEDVDTIEKALHYMHDAALYAQSQ